MKQLASIQTVLEKRHLPGTHGDKYELILVEDWWYSVEVNTYQVGDLCISFKKGFVLDSESGMNTRKSRENYNYVKHWADFPDIFFQYRDTICKETGRVIQRWNPKLLGVRTEEGICFMSIGADVTHLLASSTTFRRQK